MCHVEMFSADQPAVPDEKDLHYRIAVIRSHGNDILVFHCGICHFLLLRNHPDTAEQIAVMRCRLIIHGI